MKQIGHSQERTRSPRIMLAIWRNGNGATRLLSDDVQKSQVTLGQNKPSIAPPICISDATMITSRAQWFFISLPILLWGERIVRDKIERPRLISQLVIVCAWVMLPDQTIVWRVEKLYLLFFCFFPFFSLREDRQSQRTLPVNTFLQTGKLNSLSFYVSFVSILTSFWLSSPLNSGRGL